MEVMGIKTEEGGGGGREEMKKKKKKKLYSDITYYLWAGSVQ
jgi:hypothetical protein